MKTNLLCFFVTILFSFSANANYYKISNNFTKTNEFPEADLPDFTYERNAGPSDIEIFYINDGLLLTRPYTITAPTGYEVYATGTPDFADQIIISGALISLGPVTVYARLKAGLTVGTYNGNISVTAPETTIIVTTHPAIDYELSVTGSVTRKETAWNSGAWTNGAPGIETATTINDNYTTETHGNISAWSLDIATGKTVTVSNNSYIQVKTDASVSGTINVETKGAFVQVENTGTFTVNPGGASKVSKLTTTLNHWYDYTYWSSPVSGTIANDAFSPSNPSMRYWFNAANFLDVLAEDGNTGTYTSGHDDIDDNGNDWALLDGNTVLQPGVGYAATHSGTGFTVGNEYPYHFTGAFNTGTITTPISYNGDNGDLDWNFIGNPYPSAISIDSFFTENTGVVANAIYLWSHATPPNQSTGGNQVYNFNTNDYAIINGAGEIAGGSGLIPGRHIPSGQGFFIQGLTNSNVTFTNSMRVADNNANTQFFRDSNTVNPNKIWLNLTSNNGIFNQALIAYMDGATNNDDGSFYDALRNMSGECASVIYSTIANANNQKYAIQTKNEQSLNTNEIIPLGFYTSMGGATQFTIAIAKKDGDFFNNNPIFLKDNLLNITQDLTASDYIFTSSIGEFNNRFEIVFTDETLSVATNNLEKQLTIIELNAAEIQFKLAQENTIKSIELYNILGQLAHHITANGTTSVTVDSKSISKGVYIAKVHLTDNTFITKKLLKRL